MEAEEAEGNAAAAVVETGTQIAWLGPVSEHLAGAISRSLVAIAGTT